MLVSFKRLETESTLSNHEIKRKAQDAGKKRWKRKQRMMEME